MSTKIEWTDETWNPVTGCTKISPGCANCYAERMTARLQAMGLEKYSRGFEVAVHPDVMDQPRRWKKDRMVFVNSMSDLFHEDVPDDAIEKVFSVMNDLPQHTFQVLTKRPERLREMAPGLSWTDNIWAGVTVESNEYTYRADMLADVPAAVRFVSAEPLLGPLPDLRLDAIDWLIVGGESGPGCRPMEAEWAESLLGMAEEAGIPFFFKQWGGRKRDPVIQGRVVQEWPEQAGAARSDQRGIRCVEVHRGRHRGKEAGMNELLSFNYKGQEVRIVMIDGEPWWVLLDVCKALGISNSSDVATRRLDEDEKGVEKIYTPRGPQKMKVINERGLYNVVLRSRKPEAWEFKHWITHDVLPQIRKTGGHGQPQLPAIINADMLQGIVDNMRALEQKVDEQGVMIAAQSQKTAEKQPEVDYFDVVLQSPDPVTTNVIAQDYGMSENAFNRLLHDMGVQHKRSGIWMLHAKHASNGFTKMCTTTLRNKNTDGTPERMKWTQKGRLWLYSLLKEEGMLPMIEREGTA